MPDALQFAQEALANLPATTNAPAAGPPGVAPEMRLSQFEIARQERSQQQLPFAIRNRKDVPIDIYDSPGAMVKFQVAQRRDPIDKIQYLEQEFGKGMARIADDGTPLIRVPTTTGVKEIPVNEEGLTWSDLATIGGHAPEILGGIVLPLLARKAPGIKGGGVGGFARDVATSAVGAEAGGLVQDVAVSQAPASQLAYERAKMLPVNLAAGTVLGGAAVAAGKLISPFAAPASEQISRMRQGLSRLEDLVGEPIQLTPGQITGSPLLLRTEARMEKIPGATGTFQSIDEAQVSWFKKLQNRMLGLPAQAGPAERTALPGEEEIGSAAIGRLSQAVNEQKGALSGAQANAQRTLSNEVMEELSQATTVDRQIFPEVVGDAVRKRVVGLKEEFDTQMDQIFADLDAKLGGKDRIFRLPNMAAAAQQMKNELPQSGGEVSRQFVPSNVVGKLDEMIQAGNEYRSLSDLRKMRTEVRNDIKASEAIPGTQTHYLSRISDMLTEAMTEAAQQNPASGLKPALDAANKAYREGIEPFKEKYIARLFHNIDQPGFVAEEAIVSNITPSQYQSYKRMLGENSTEFGMLKRSIVDDMLKRSTNNGVIDGQAFLNQLKDLYVNKTSIFQEILGSKEANLRQLSLLLDDTGAKLNPDSLRAVLAQPGAIGKPEIRTTIGRLLDEEAKLDKLYRSKILKDIGEGRLGDNFGDTATFVSRFMDTASPTEAAKVMSILSDRPGLQEDIKRKMIQSIFFEAQAAAMPREVATLGRGEAARMASERKLHEIFGDEQRKKVLTTLLGEDTYNNFKALADVLAGTQRVEQAFAASGGIAGGALVGRMVSDPLSYAPEWVKQKIASVLITMPILRSWARGTTMTPERIGAMTRMAIGSREFLEAAATEFGPNQLPWIISQLDQSITRSEQAGPMGNRPTGELPGTAMEFINQLQSQQTNAPPPPRILRTQ